MDNSIESNYKRLEKIICWTKKMSNAFYFVSSDDKDNEEIINNIDFFLKDKIKENTNNDFYVKEVKVLDLSYFNPKNDIKNQQTLLQELENNIYIIDCTKVNEGQEEALKQLISFYHIASNNKTTFSYVFKEKDISKYVALTEIWQMRTCSFTINKEDFAIYRLYKEMSKKYEQKKSLAIEKKVKI